MSKTVQWSIHRDDSKIGETETIEDDFLADRYISTGMAVPVDDAEDGATEGDTAPADDAASGQAQSAAPETARPARTAPRGGSAAATKNPTDAGEVVGSPADQSKS
ncbi:hypothetical protein ACTHQY_14945 [Rhodococcoides corynebacterioides]|uniref:hypothetical protein n=1 Tax=Rhodococcoides corynebacterioides TaxID=53972 RepID=UPI003F7D516B